MTQVAQMTSFQSGSRQNVPHDIKIYPGAKHSFFNDANKNYNESAAQDSWGRVLAFFEEHLGAKAE